MPVGQLDLAKKSGAECAQIDTGHLGGAKLSMVSGITPGGGSDSVFWQY